MDEGAKRFNSATDAEILAAEVADSYFHRTMEVLRYKGLENTPVHAEVAYKTSDPDAWFVVAGMDEVATLLDGLGGVEVRAVPEGEICHPHEPVLTLSGPYGAFAEHETAILGFLCQASGIATGAARCRLAAGGKPVVSFGARRMHPSAAPMIERAAYLGGCDLVAVDLATRRLGIPATGTLPHALILVIGSTAEAAKAFDEAMPPDVPREVRWELDRHGYGHVKIFASGGIDVEYILHLNPVCDAYGVGGAIADAPMIDYSLDIVEVDGDDRSKRGKRGGKKRLVELPDGARRILPANSPIPEGSRDILAPLDASPKPVSELRERVLEQLATGEFPL